MSAFTVLSRWIGAKGWYVALHRGRQFDGWCIQGAIAGGALVAAAVPLVGLDISVGTYLNAAAPGLLLGMAIGRAGCFWSGCCTGRPTRSHWGIWSSNRQVGVRRIPTQLLESVLSLTIGLAALITVLQQGLGNSGAVLFGALATYTLGRQLILPLRAEPRQTSVGRSVTIAVCGWRGGSGTGLRRRRRRRGDTVQSVRACIDFRSGDPSIIPSGTGVGRSPKQRRPPLAAVPAATLRRDRASHLGCDRDRASTTAAQPSTSPRQHQTYQGDGLNTSDSKRTGGELRGLGGRVPGRGATTRKLDRRVAPRPKLDRQRPKCRAATPSRGGPTN